MDISSKQSDESERLLRRYLATRPDISDLHKEKIVKHYMFVFDPNYSEKKSIQHFDQLAENDPLFRQIGMEALAGFLKWIAKDSKQKTNFFTNLFKSKN